MKIKSLIALTLCLAVLALAGCGSSSSDNPPVTTQPGTQPALSTVINGLASKGPINTGTVKVFAVRDGVTDTSVPIAQGTTDANGNFTVDAGGFNGPVVVEVTGGSFTDEVSGTQVTLKTKMRTMVASTGTGTNTVAVTPLTELAAKRTETHAAITPDVINESNKNVGATFNLTDIVTTLPIASGNAEQKKHASACGSISQLINTSKHAGESLDDALTRVMGEMESEIEHAGGLSDDSLNKINTAVTEFNNSGKNPSGSVAPSATPTDGVLKISTAGANVMGALDMTIDLPAGVTVNVADPATGEAAAGTVTNSGSAGAGTQVVAKVIPAAGSTPGKMVIGMINSTGFGAGECLTIDFKIAAGANFPAATDFGITGVSAKDANAKLINGVTAAPKSVAMM
jgi:hypothetical protein